MCAWREQIGSIIAETERNLGMKVSRPPSVSFRPAPAIFAHPAAAVLSGSSYSGGGLAAVSSSSSAAGSCSGEAATTTSSIASVNTALATKQLLSEAATAAAGSGPNAAMANMSSVGSASMAASAQESLRPLLQQSMDGGAASNARLLETMKFEMDVRTKHTSAQLDAVREEMANAATATEKKWVEIARQMESSVGGQLDAESKLRGHTDAQLAQLRDASAHAHQETMRVVGAFQQTAIDPMHAHRVHPLMRMARA